MYSFDLDFDPLVSRPDLEEYARAIAINSTIHSQVVFDTFCRQVCTQWDQFFNKVPDRGSAKFNKISSIIADGPVEEKVIQTSWGGVVVTKHLHPEVEKYLLIRKGGYLALEKHSEKYESLEVVEGVGMLLSGTNQNSRLYVQYVKEGDLFEFSPGVEHCIIGTENLLIFEKSVDPKGMDEDLIFIYQGTRA